jgi:S-adenosylmethionine decarboxylase
MSRAVSPEFPDILSLASMTMFLDTDDRPGMKDLAPAIFRQRLVVEGTCPEPINDQQICAYLRQLSTVCGMHALNEPVTHRSDMYGWAGWIHWETSGAHFYAWEQPLLFFSVDIYTCKPFDVDDVVGFTEAFFAAGQIVSRSF